MSVLSTALMQMHGVFASFWTKNISCCCNFSTLELPWLLRKYSDQQQWYHKSVWSSLLQLCKFDVNCRSFRTFSLQSSANWSDSVEFSQDSYDDTTAPSQAPTESLAPTFDRSVQGFSYVGSGYCLDSNFEDFDNFALNVDLAVCGPSCAASAGNSIEELVGFELTTCNTAYAFSLMDIFPLLPLPFHF